MAVGQKRSTNGQKLDFFHPVIFETVLDFPDVLSYAYALLLFMSVVSNSLIKSLRLEVIGQLSFLPTLENCICNHQEQKMGFSRIPCKEK